MDALLTLLILFWIVRAIAKSLSPNKKKRKAAETSLDDAAAADGQAREERAARAARMREAIRRREAARKAPFQPMEGMQEAAGEGESAMAVDDEHPFMRPEYAGSMRMHSDEGRDTCAPSLAHERPAQPREEWDTASAGADEGPFAPDAQAMVMGVVMSEILTRPCDRKWGRR